MKKTLKNLKTVNLQKTKTPKKSKKTKNSKKPTFKKYKGSGFTEVLYKYTLGEKRSEIIPQAKSIFEGIRQGYGLGGIGGWTDFAWDNGGDEYLLTVPLSAIMLWHPVRGQGEREQAGRKTTIRSESTYNVLMNTLSETKDTNMTIITYSKEDPLTYDQLNSIPEMSSDDTIKICPVNIDNNPEDREDIDVLTTNIVDLNKRLIQTKNSTLSRDIETKIRSTSNQLQDLLYDDDRYTQIFLVLSGQGRLQAIIEAVKKANIQPDTFYIRLTCKNIYLDICNVLLKIHNAWVERGDFNDERHEVYLDGKYIPMSQVNLAFSCSKNISKQDTVCYSNYKTGNVTSDNMGCANVYDYSKRIPITRYFTK